ncbi:MAG: sugar-binding protein [Planctomycetota bacterium]
MAGEGEYPAAVLTMKQTPAREDINGSPASAKVFHDGKSLYVIITVPFKDGGNLSKGEQWVQDDAAEVCFCDASNTQAGPTFVIHGFASGKHESTTNGGATEDAAEKLGKAVKYAAKIDKQSWTGEWAIPFEAAGLKYKPGMKLSFNLGAWRSEDAEWIIWCGAEGPTYQLENGGKLTLE